MGEVAIFAGAWGSGKSEISINYALEKAGTDQPVYLADLDMSSPYFVSRDAWSMASLLTEKVHLIAPDQHLAQGDVPNLPPEIMGFIRNDIDLVIDLAGDQNGALVLGYISRLVQARQRFSLYMVINPFRPFSSTEEEIEAMKTLLEKAANIPFTAIVSNPNLVEETTIAHIHEGHKRVLNFSEKLNLPVQWLAVEARHYLELFPYYGNYLRKIHLYLRPDWLQGIGGGMLYGQGEDLFPD